MLIKAESGVSRRQVNNPLNDISSRDLFLYPKNEVIHETSSFALNDTIHVFLNVMLIFY